MAPEVSFIDVHVHVLEVLGLPVQHEVMKVAAVVHADGLGRMRESTQQSLKDSPAHPDLCFVQYIREAKAVTCIRLHCCSAMLAP